MTILEIYEKYKIMPTLQMHMLRVGAVGKIICDAINNQEFENKNGDKKQIVNKDQIVNMGDVVTACLLHDMGNIIKFDLTLFPDFTKTEGLEYWLQVQKEFKEKYGNEHVGSLEIAKEIGINKNVLELMSLTGFSKVLKVTGENISMEQKICNYADMRVGPHGVLSMDTRIRDGQERHKRNNSGSKKEGLVFEQVAEGLKLLEGQIFSKTSIFTSDIFNDRVNLEIEGLKNWVI